MNNIKILLSRKDKILNSENTGLTNKGSNVSYK